MMDLTAELGPQYTLELKDTGITLDVGVKSSSLFKGDDQPGVYKPSTGYDVLAAENLTGFRAVTFHGLHTQATVASLKAFAGVITEDIATTQFGRMVTDGIVENPAWTWTPDGEVFAIADGVLTQTVPALPILAIGRALTATKLMVRPQIVIGA